jgi:hypothetical protein
VAGLWPCVSASDCAYGTCSNGMCPQIPDGGFCTQMVYSAIPECASGTCGGSTGTFLVTPPGSLSHGTSACGP